MTSTHSSSARSPRVSLDLSPIPRTQALTSTTFRPPPLDGSLTIPELYDWHYENSPDHPLFIYSDDEGNVTTIKWPEAVRAVHKAGHIVRDLACRNGLTARPIFAILAGNDTITYFTLAAGIFRAGYTAFPVSPRNSPAAVAHLLTKTSVAHIFIGPEHALQTLASEAFKLMVNAGHKLPTSSQVPRFEAMYTKDSVETFERLPPLDFKWDDPLVMLHSSGSTAFPKPLNWTHERLLLGCLSPWFGERDLTGQRLACHSMPMFHGMGVMQIGWTAFSGLVLTVFKPQVPAVAPTPESVVKGAMDTGSDFIFCVPSFVEAWASNPAHVERLKSIEGIIYGGGPLSQAVGDELTRQGVSIFAMYGNTECGINNVILPKSAEKDWQYFSFPANTRPHFVDDEDGNAELVLLDHQMQKPLIINTNIDGVDGYATSDIMTPHPTKPGFWKIFGRADDQIMHNTGEKTNPGPLENILNQDPHVHTALLFGRGRFNAGVLINPEPASRFDPVDEAKLAEFRNLIWPTIEKLNAYAPQHSRVFKEMIIVASPAKPFTYTAKNTPRRQAIINDYEPEIDALYQAVEESAQADLQVPDAWDVLCLTPYVRAVVSRVLKRNMGDTDDIFLKGCDSLQATWIRNSLLHALKVGAKANTREISTSFVYQYPTIQALTLFMTNQATQGSTDSAYSVEAKIQQMQQMVEKYSANFPPHTPSKSTCVPERDTILLTGTTGSLGATILAELVASSAVARVYALNRKGKKSLLERHGEIFKLRELDARLLESPKVVLLEAEVEQEDMGLPAEMLQEIRQSATHIIHNAWPVNFNLSLQSFEPNVKSVRRLIDLALSSPRSSPAHLLFVSSVGVLRNAESSQPMTEAPVPPTVPIGSGYGEAKWVCEQILSVAAEKTALRPSCVRVGQISGSTSSGAWSHSEWIPSLIRSSVKLNALPIIDNDISLLPADATARAIVEMRGTTVPFLHLSHPRAVAWPVILDATARELDLPRVPFDVWFSALEKSGEGLSAENEVEMVRENPALKLLSFFAQGTGRRGSAGAFGIQALDNSKALAVSRTLCELPPLTGEDALSWLSYWRRTAFL